MNQQVAEDHEVGLPQDYRLLLIFYRSNATVCTFLSLLTFSFWFETATSIKVHIQKTEIVHQSLILVIVSAGLLVYFYLTGGTVFRSFQQLKDKNVSFLIIVTSIIFFKVPYYSIVFFGILAWDIVITIRSIVQNNNQLIGAWIILDIFGATLAVYFLKQEQFIPIMATVYMTLYFILFVQIWIFFTLIKILNINLGYFRMSVCHEHIVVPLSISATLTNLFVSFMKFYLPKEIFLNLAFMTSVLGLIAGVFMGYFAFELTLFSGSPWQETRIIVRYHNRSFKKRFKQINNRNSNKQKWKQQACLFCGNLATQVQFPCGHLTLCRSCSNKYGKKGVRICCLCGKMTQNEGTKAIALQRKQIVYQTKVRIRKSLPEPFYLTLD